jgi:hypothetical protein
LLFGLLLALLILLATEGLSHVAIALLAGNARLDFDPIAERHLALQSKLRELFESRERALVQIDPEIGWVYGPDHRGELYSSNSRGLRGRREYGDVAPAGVLRIAAFGDSFVHANEVSDAESWSARLEEIDGRIEVANYGVGGYGTDQALLLYERRGLELGPRVVLLGFTDVNYARNVNRYVRFRSANSLPLFKPRFRLTGTEARRLELLPSAFPGEAAMKVLLDSPDQVLRSAEHDWWFRPLEWRNPLYDHLASIRLASTLGGRAWNARLRPGRLYRSGAMNPDSDAFELLVAIVKRFAQIAQARGQHFVFMLFPDESEDIWGDGARSYQPLLDRLEGDVRIVDLADALREDASVTAENMRRPGRHYGPEANRTVARAVRRELLDNGWLEPR